MSEGIFRRVYPAGAQIFHEGELGDFAFIIERGEIEISVGSGDMKEVLAIIGPGELFGELAALDGYARSANAVALTECELILISQEQIRHRVNSGDEIVALLLRSVLRSYRGDRRNITGWSDTGMPSLDVFASGPDGHSRAVAKLRLENELKQALARNEFELYFQPLVYLADETLSGFEALIRWNSPLRGPVGPDQFLRLAEEAGLMIAIGHWVVGAAVRKFATFQHAFGSARDLFIAINVTKHYLHDPQFLEDLAAGADACGLKPKQIKIELTESVLIDDTEGAITWIKRCKQLGFRVSIDDFGTGYSSLGYLHRLPVDELKIDKSFVETMIIDHRSMAVVKAIVGLADGLDLDVVAEGIETKEQAEVLRELGCVYGQGYRFARPLTADQVMSSIAGEATKARSAG
ncbi:EAL domain-containing protein [Dongia sedimenti]|uniref:EAL domain-containing protein n=1 Tax=Dongia sedimenti TaxID=3064282 RepID=A0ABU0YI63_9PROT|nr:EAL domain-containing protein [Rhodospirillaceae bacterium R-7]